LELLNTELAINANAGKCVAQEKHLANTATAMELHASTAHHMDG
jgi:hypothetical protein